MPRRTRLRTFVAWARRKLCPWRKARQEAIQAIRDGWAIADLAREGHVSRQWLHTWWRRFVDKGKHWRSLEDRPSTPHHTPTKKRHLHVDQILQAKNEHPGLGVVKLAIVANLPLGHTTIHQVLRENNACAKRQRIWRKYRRFCRPFPNYLWQLDITQVPLRSGQWVFIASLIDDHSRFLLASRCYAQELNTGDVVGLVRTAVAQWGCPRQILTDRGCQFTSTQSDDPSLFTLTLDAIGIRHIMGRPHHPRTQGKIERWHRSLKHEWFAYHDVQDTLDQVHGLLARWLEFYNFTRPHWSLQMRTPGEVHLGSLFLSEPLARAVNEVSG